LGFRPKGVVGTEEEASSDEGLRGTGLVGRGRERRWRKSYWKAGMVAVKPTQAP
jgi:hypothetical protein